jgi:glycosyltransferase involved in cell wall biosynthesis
MPKWSSTSWAVLNINQRQGRAPKSTRQLVNRSTPVMPDGAMAIKVTLYIPCFNGEQTLPFCLAGALSQSLVPDEIIVVDDGSSDRTARIAKRYGVKLVQHDRNLGLSAARNTAIRESTGDLIAALDADCVPERGWLEAMVKLMEANPGLTGIGGAVLETNKTTIADQWRTNHMKQHLGKQPVTNPQFLFGANTVFRRAALLAAYPYPEILRTNGEDLEMCLRMQTRVPGRRLFYTPTAIVYHLRGDTITSLLNNYWRYQTYASWVGRPATGFGDRTLQTYRMLRVLWAERLPIDLRERRWGGILIVLMATPYLISKQAREFWRTSPQRRTARAKGTTAAS